MKPLEIEFAAFGSYPGTVTVDFAALSARGLFVVSGDTGPGTPQRSGRPGARRGATSCRTSPAG